MQTMIDSIYDRLRAIGVSVETADATALMLVDYSHDKREAFYLWCTGTTEVKAGAAVNLSHSTISRMINSLHKISNSVVEVSMKNVQR